MNGGIKTRAPTWLYPKWCGRRDLNSHAVKHWNLNPACHQFHHFRVDASYNSHSKRMAGVTGLEPMNGGIKPAALPTWLYPSRGAEGET